jgi:hypothetical protein
VFQQTYLGLIIYVELFNGVSGNDAPWGTTVLVWGVSGGAADSIRHRLLPSRAAPTVCGTSFGHPARQLVLVGDHRFCLLVSILHSD